MEQFTHFASTERGQRKIDRKQQAEIAKLAANAK
jgi:hypothetical protein